MSQDDTSARARILLGDARFRAGDLRGALAAYGLPEDVGLAWRVGRCRQVLGELAAAQEAYAAPLATGGDVADRAQLLAWRATAWFHRGDHVRCRADVGEADALVRGENLSDEVLATVRTAQAMEAALRTDRVANVAFYETALTHARAAADAFQQLRILNNLGSQAMEEGEWDRALRWLDEALALPDNTNWPTLLAVSVVNRAEIFLALGRLEESTADLLSARKTFARHGSPLAAYSVLLLGEVFRLRGDSALARLTLEEAVAISGRQGDAQAGVRALATLGLLLVRDEPGLAAQCATRARQLGSSLRASRLDALEARIAVAREDWPGAVLAATAAVDAARTDRDRPGLAEALEALAAAEPARAGEHLRQALGIWRNLADPIGTARVELRMAAVTGDPAALGAVRRLERRLRDLGARGLAQTAAEVGASLEARPVGTTICCLGAFKVFTGSSAVPLAAWGSRKPRELLMLLICEQGRPVSREALVEALWPGDPPRDCLPRLSVALSNLRRILAAPGRPEAVVASRDTVYLDLDAIVVDAVEFRELADRGVRALARDPEAGIDALAAAEALFRGEFFAEEPYDERVEPLRNDLREVYRSVLRRLAAHAEETGDHEGAVRRLLRLLEIDEFDESAHVALVAALVAGRRFGEARRRHARYAAAMDELGVRAEPFPEVG